MAYANRSFPPRFPRKWLSPGQRNIPINISYTAETREVWRVVRDEGGSSSPGGVRARGSAEHERAKDSVVITLPRFFRGVRLLIPRVYIYACLGRTTTTTIIRRRRRRRRVERYTWTKCKGEEEQGGVRIPKMEGIEERRKKRGRGGRNEWARTSRRKRQAREARKSRNAKKEKKRRKGEEEEEVYRPGDPT